MMPGEKVLVSGAGVAGSIVAFWLAKYDFQVTVVERANAHQKLGQGIEIEEPALKVVKAMGILDKLNEVRTGELGFTLVDAQARSCGSFEAGGVSPTGALEIMRGDLTEVLYHAADEFANVTYHFETTIRSLTQDLDKVTAHIEDRSKKSTRVEEFDFVIGADGVKSRVRQLAMGPSEELDCFKSLGLFVAYFSIPKEDQDWPNSRLCNFPGRRILWIRPVGKDAKVTSVYFIYAHGDVPALRNAIATGDRQAQKKVLAEIYSGLGWETPRVLEQMMNAENFYADELTQVKLQQWSRQRVALVGDAAWAPTPMTGEGNQLAIIGAFVLAQEMSRNRGQVAFEMYEKRLRAYVESCQKIPLGGYAPYIFNPQTALGIWILQTIMHFFSWTVHLLSGTRLAKMLPEGHPDDFDLEIEKSGDAMVA